jgi:hypothetical protein
MKVPLGHTPVVSRLLPVTVPLHFVSKAVLNAAELIPVEFGSPRSFAA